MLPPARNALQPQYTPETAVWNRPQLNARRALKACEARCCCRQRDSRPGSLRLRLRALQLVLHELPPHVLRHAARHAGVEVEGLQLGGITAPQQAGGRAGSSSSLQQADPALWVLATHGPGKGHLWLQTQVGPQVVEMLVRGNKQSSDCWRARLALRAHTAPDEGRGEGRLGRAIGRLGLGLCQLQATNSRRWVGWPVRQDQGEQGTQPLPWQTLC